VALAIGVAGGLLALRFNERASTEVGSPTLTLGGQQTIPDGWEAFSAKAVEGYVARGEPVFLAFGARWCWTCRVNESTALAAGDVRESFAAHGVHLVYGDFTNGDDAIAAWLRRFGRAGVPLYVYFPPEGGKPVVLPELLTRRMVLGALEG
jgi:thiol:disulfide interchange protein DsbD